MVARVSFAYGGAVFALVGVGVLSGCGGSGVSTGPGSTVPEAQVLVIQNNKVLTQDLSGANPRILGSTNAAPWTTISADGRTLAIPTQDAAHKYDVTLYNSQTGASQAGFTGVSASSLALSPDSMALAYIESQPALQIKTVDRLTQTTRNWGPVVSDMLTGSGLAWDPLNRYIATVRLSDNQVILVARSTVSVPIKVGRGSNPSFSPNGSMVAYITPDYNVGLYNVATHTTRVLDPVDDVETVAFGFDNKSLVVTALQQVSTTSRMAHVATMSLSSNELTYAASAPAEPQVAVGLAYK